MAEAPVRALSSFRVDATEEEFREITEDEHDQLIATEMAALTAKDIQPPSEPTLPVASSHPSSLDLPESTTTSTATKPTPPENTANPGSPHPSPSEDHTHTPTATTTPSTPMSSPISPSSEVEDKLVSLIAATSIQSKPENVDMIYFLDSGGQPQFQDLLPLFLDPASIMIFVTRLSERLDHHPMIAYYEQGKPLSEPQPSLLSHLETLQHSVQALQSQVYARQSQVSMCAPSLVVVGTHRDKEKQCTETQAEKNAKLTSLLYPAFHKQLIFRGEDTKEVIFPVNTKQPDENDRQVASEIRKAIRHIASSTEREKIPLSWYVLQTAMKRMAAAKKRGFLTREECLQLAHSLHISEGEFDAALDYLTRLNLIFYFRDILPGIIFVSPQVLLDKLTELVHRSYELRNNPDRKKSVTYASELIKFRDKGLVTLQFLFDSSFSKHYSDLFTPKHLVQLLLFRSVIAKVGEDEYFMPFILPQLSLEELEKHRVQPSSSAAPLVITFHDSVVPSGFFPVLIASLLSSGSPYSLELLPSPTNCGQPACVFRNCIKFRLPFGAPGSLTLIDSFTHLEAHMDAPDSACSKLCPPIKKAIFNHLEDACSALKFHSLSPQASVLCESRLLHGETNTRSALQVLRGVFGKQTTQARHHADVSTITNSWTCSLAPSVIHGELQDRHLLWFSTEATAGEISVLCH